MRYFPSTTDREVRDQYLIECDMRHEQRVQQNMVVSTLESTPPDSPQPRLSMAAYRQQKLDTDTARAKSVLETMGDYDDLKF